MTDAIHIPTIPARPCGAVSAMRRPRRQRGLTLFEVLLAGAVIACMLGVFVGVSESLVSDSSKEQTVAVLRTLGSALQRYHDNHRGQWPSATLDHDRQTAMERCLAALRASPETDRMVDGLPGLKRVGEWYTILDGFGHEMVYVDPADTSPANAAWVHRFPHSRSNRPFVASAGEDGQFGDSSSLNLDITKLAADNLYSFEEYMEPTP